MHTLDKLEQAIVAARRLGYRIRYECLGGVAGGPCEIGGTRWIFIDLALSAVEQLDQVQQALEADHSYVPNDQAPLLAGAQDQRRAA